MASGLLFSSLILGLLGGVHCTAMCSGLVCSLCGSRELKAQYGLLCGRLLSYTAASALALLMLLAPQLRFFQFNTTVHMHLPAAGFQTVQ